MRVNPEWSKAVEQLADPEFVGYHGLLATLLSIKCNRVIGYRVSSVYQVVEASHRRGVNDSTLTHPFALIVFLACKVWQPTLSEKNERWIESKRREAFASLKEGAGDFRRTRRFDRAIALLFPDLVEPMRSWPFEWSG